MTELLAAIAGAAVVGVSLGLLGSGGSILCVPLLVYLVGRGDKQAIAESLAIVGSIAAFGAVRRGMAGQVRWGAVAAFAPASIVGAAAGAYASRFIPGPAQLVGLGATMLVAAVLMLRRAKEESPERAEAPVRLWAFVLAGLGVGVLTGALGVGGGFLIVPVLVVFGRLSQGPAVGTSLALIAVNAAVGFATHALGERDYAISGRIILIFAAAGAAGTIAGQALGGRLDQRAFRRVFAVFLLVIGAAMLVREGMRL